MKYLNTILNRFWRRWRSEYLLELRERHRHGNKTSGTVEISVSGVVVIQGRIEPHTFWKLGNVGETLPGRDGQVRGAVVGVFTGGKRSKLMCRPVQRLYLLEFNGHLNASGPDPPAEPTLSGGTSFMSEDPQPLRRSKRAAAF